MQSPNRLRNIVLLLLLTIIVASFWLVEFLGEEVHSNIPVVLEDDVATTTLGAIVGPVLPRSLPVLLKIPALDIETSFTTPLPLAPSGEVSVPKDNDKVGWYENSPTPGEAGPAIVLGHVDSYTGPAIFFYLGQLKPGDDIFITREDGSEAHFVVTLLERYGQDQFPTVKVYGNIDHAGLRLITCSGTYKQGVGRYTHNLVVYAKLVE